MFELSIDGEFAAAHFLREYEGKCENLHGHNWKVQLRLRADGLNSIGMVLDFKDARAVLTDVLNRFDHKCLNELSEFKEVNPTTENLSRMICEEVSARLPEGVKVSRVTCWESERCSASYYAP